LLSYNFYIKDFWSFGKRGGVTHSLFYRLLFISLTLLYKLLF